MLRFEWNALQVGDAVVLHDSAATEFALRAGTVTMVEPKRSKRGENGVGIRVDTAGGRRVLWPSFLTVHLDPLDPAHACWLCAALVDGALPELGSPAPADAAALH